MDGRKFTSSIIRTLQDVPMPLPPRHGRDPASGMPRYTPPIWDLTLLQRLEWKRFGEVCEKFYRLKGISCQPVSPALAYGPDLLLQQAGTESPTALVKCKPWSHPPHGERVIIETVGRMSGLRIGKAFIFTPGQFDQDAVRLARESRVTLIDGPMFLAMINRLPARQREMLLVFAARGDYATPTCPSCGRKMRRIIMDQANAKGWRCSDSRHCPMHLLTLHPQCADETPHPARS
jgi:restriction system protein